MDSTNNLGLLTDLMSWFTLALCLIVIVAIYSAIGRLAHHPHVLFALGLLFMVGTYVLYRLAPPGTDRPIEISIATLGGNLIVVAFVMRAERAQRYWKQRLEQRIAHTEDILQRLEAKEQTLNRDDSNLPDILDRITKRDTELQGLRNKLQADDE